jgi:hypothetical protein
MLLIPMHRAYEGARPVALASRAAGRLIGFLLVMGIVVTTLGGCRTPQNEPSTLVTLYHSPENLPPLPFVVFPADTGGRVYRNPMWGIEILGVWGDGKRIQPEPLFIDFDQLPDPFTVRVSGDLFVYRVQSSELGPDTPLEADHWFGVFASKMTSDDYDVERYAVPHKSSQVEVQYRARGKSYRGVGRVMTLRLLKYDPNRKPSSGDTHNRPHVKGDFAPEVRPRSRSLLSLLSFPW